MREPTGWGATASLLLQRAMRAGTVAGMVAFALGFFVHPVFRPSNLSPILGFMLAPAGFLAGALVSLAWNLGRATSRPLVSVGVLAGLLVAQWAFLMSRPGMMLRGMVLDADFLPEAVVATQAPAGVLRVWVVDLPPGEQEAHLKRMRHYLGGPTLELRGYYAVRFVRAEDVAAALAGAGAQRPDVVAVNGPDPAAVTRSRGLTEVTGHFAYRAMAPRTWVDPRSPHHALARALALGDLDCRSLTAPGPSASGDDPELPAFALRHASAWLAGDAAALAASTSPEALDPDPVTRQPPSPPRTDFKVVGSRVCGAWGSRVLAFAYLVVNHESEGWIGQTRITLAARHERGTWRAIGVSRADASRESLLRSSEAFDRAMAGEVRGVDALRAGQPQTQGRFGPARDARAREGHLVWRPSGSSGVVAEVVEVACRLPEGGVADRDLQFVLRPRRVGEPSPYFVAAASACPDGWPTRWRIWSVTPDALAFSEPEALPDPER